MAVKDYDSLIQKLVDIEKEVKSIGSLYSSRKLFQCIAKSLKAQEAIEEVENNYPQEVKFELKFRHPQFILSEFLQEYRTIINWYLAISYVQSGQFQNAIKVLSISISGNAAKSNSYSYYESLTQFIEVAQKIPLRYDIITKAHTDVTSFLREIGKHHWRHELILMKSRFELLRGNFEDAYYMAKEALAIALMSENMKDKYSGQVWDFHYDGLISICLSLNKISEAKSYVLQWVNSENQMPSNRLIRMNKCLSDIARFEGDLVEAERYAKIAIKYSDDTDYEETQFSCLCSLLNTCIDSKQFEKAKVDDKRFLKLESSERLYIKYHLSLIKFKLTNYNIIIGIDITETKQKLLEYGTTLNSLLSVGFYQTDLLHKNKTIVY